MKIEAHAMLSAGEQLLVGRNEKGPYVLVNDALVPGRPSFPLVLRAENAAVGTHAQPGIVIGSFDGLYTLKRIGESLPGIGILI